MLTPLTWAPGPDQWPTLGFPLCAGQRQSPINVVTDRVAVTRLPALMFRHFDQTPLTLTLANNYHSGEQPAACSHTVRGDWRPRRHTGYGRHRH